VANVPSGPRWTPPLLFVIKQIKIISVGVAGYRLEGRSSIPDIGKIFSLSAPSKAVLGPTQLPIQRVPGVLSQKVNRQSREADGGMMTGRGNRSIRRKPALRLPQ
jgi:hypothetical protein